MEYYMDDHKWQVSDTSSSSSSRSSSLSRSVSSRTSTTGSKKNTNPFSLSRSTSQKPASKSSFSRKCTNMAKEQKAKFYIVKRCITMLVSWKKNNHENDYDDDDS